MHALFCFFSVLLGLDFKRLRRVDRQKNMLIMPDCPYIIYKGEKEVRLTGRLLGMFSGSHLFLFWTGNG